VKDSNLPIGHHLLELRRRMTWMALVIVACSAVSFAFHQQILTLLMEPAKGFAGIPTEKPIYTDLTEFLGVAMKVSLLSGIVISMPFTLFQVAMFVSPGLTPWERRYLFMLLPVSILIFAIGAAFGYRVLFPPAVTFLLTFGNDIATPYIRIGSYANLMLSLLFWMGVVFETPLVMFFLSRIGVVSYKFFARQRRYAVVVAFVLGAIITPTFDPFNQTLVALPIIVLYEAGIWLARIGGRKRQAASPELELDSRR
jgi:sec-independent protein translocase protein TatC